MTLGSSELLLSFCIQLKFSFNLTKEINGTNVLGKQTSILLICALLKGQYQDLGLEYSSLFSTVNFSYLVIKCRIKALFFFEKSFQSLLLKCFPEIISENVNVD